MRRKSLKHFTFTSLLVPDARLLYSSFVLRISKHNSDDITVAVKLGRAVKHSRLTAVLQDRFVTRVTAGGVRRLRGQAGFLRAGGWSTR